MLTGSLGVLLALVGLLAYGMATTPARADSDTPSGTVQTVDVRTLYPTTLITQAGIIFSPRTLGGEEVWLTQNYHAGELFATVDVSGTAAITITPQYSPDGVLWADAVRVNDNGTTTTPQIVLTADGSSYVRLLLAGVYTRAKIETTGTLTPSLQLVTRNNGGQ
jgi:hypothetical protein